MAALLLIGGTVWALASYFQEGTGAPEPAAPPQAAEEVVVDELVVDEVPLAEEDPEPVTSGFQRVEHESGSFSLEVPSGWQDLYTGYDGTFEGEDVDAGEGIGPAITATTDIDAWSTGGYALGVYAVASRELAEEYGADELATSGSNDRSPCEVGDRQEFDRYPYRGSTQWWNCPGDGSTFLTLGAASENRDCAVMLQIKTYNEAGHEEAWHILDTFEADCGGSASY